MRRRSIPSIGYRKAPDRRAEPWRARYGSPEFRAARLVAIERTGGRCAECGKVAAMPDGDGGWRMLPGSGVHHVVKLRDGGSDDPRFLALLCRRCHYRADHREGE